MQRLAVRSMQDSLAQTCVRRTASLRATGVASGRLRKLGEVLDARRTRLQAQDGFADARMRSAAGAVAVYKALAGGWPQRMPAAVAAAGG